MRRLVVEVILVTVVGAAVVILVEVGVIIDKTKTRQKSVRSKERIRGVQKKKGEEEEERESIRKIKEKNGR